MAKTVARRSVRASGPKNVRKRGRRAGWVRKNIIVDQKKLDAARQLLGARTETDAIDQALDFVAFRNQLARAIPAMRLAGGVDDVLEN